MRRSTKSLIFVVLGIISIGAVSLVSLRSALALPGSGKAKVQVPSFPPLSQLRPTIYDENGCLRISEADGGGVKCGPKSLPHPTPVPHESDSQVLRGFSGPYYATEVTGQAVVLLDQSITMAKAGSWNALGLVRNETMHPVGNVQVNARLFDATGTTHTTVSTTVPVSFLRSGEPAPFKAEAAVDAAQVSRVEWTVTAGTPTGPVQRDFQIYTSYELAYGVTKDHGVDRKDAPYPYVLAIGVRNLGETVINPTLLVAWLDDEGRVVWLESADEKPARVRELKKDEVADFRDITIGDVTVGSRLASSAKMLWVVTR